MTIESGRVFIDGEVLDEVVQTDSMTDAGLASEPVTLGEDEYFVLGDNRNFSSDSRDPDVGNIRRDEISEKYGFGCGLWERGRGSSGGRIS